VIARGHIKKTDQDLVAAPRFAQAEHDEVTDVGSRDLPFHEQRIRGIPERFPGLGNPLVQVIRRRLAAFALRRHRAYATARAYLVRQVLAFNRAALLRDDETLDGVLQL